MDDDRLEQSAAEVVTTVNSTECATVQPPVLASTYPMAQRPRHAAGLNASEHRLSKQAMSHVRPGTRTGVCVGVTEAVTEMVPVREGVADPDAEVDKEVLDDIV